MNDINLAEIRARAEAANDDVGLLYDMRSDGWHVVCDKSTSRLLMHAPEDVPALLAEVERLRCGRDICRAERDRLAATVDRVREALAGHPRCEKHAGDDPITCGWKQAVLDVQAAIEGTDS